MLAIGVNHKWDACPRKGSTQAPVHPHINYQSTERESYERYETSLTIIPMCPWDHFPHYKKLSRLVLCNKKDWAILLHFMYFHCLLPVTIILSQNYLLPIISVLAENTLLKNAYHFLLLLVGFDTLTYPKDYDRSPILVGHHLAHGDLLVKLN